MLFNSLEFALFFPTVVLGYFALPHAHRWKLVLVASYVFYMSWSAWYGLLLFLLTFVDWFAARKMEDARSPGERSAWLGVTLTGNLGMLFTFKYYNLVNESMGWLASSGPMFPVMQVMVPVGISFHTFQTIGYAVDVWRGRTRAERSLGMFALYVSFFPQLMAGPIERADHLIPQLRSPAPVDWERIGSGLRIAGWGLFKKVVVADRLGVLVDAVYGDVTTFSGFAYLIAMLFFGYQVYCDFSGYSDMAVGTARVLGIDLMKNFDQPHGSRSMTEWWTRWHISLSSWFRDYLYFPLGGNRGPFWMWARNITVVFLVSGIWHGASWKFLIWGFMHAVLVVGDRLTKPLRERVVHAAGIDRFPALRNAMAIGCTFALWLCTLVPFRADTWADAMYVFTHLGAGWGYFGELEAFLRFLARVRLEPTMFVWCLLLMPVVEVVDWLRRDPERAERWSRASTPVRWGLDYALAFSILLFGYWVDAPFVYFQF